MHQPCRRCGATSVECFANAYSRLCNGCRAADPRPAPRRAYEARHCFHCFELKPPVSFPFGPSGVKRLHTCNDCIAKEAEERRLKANERVATWKSYKGVIVRRCCSCKTVHPLTEEHFYTRSNAPKACERFSYYCRSCELELRRERALDKRLQRDPVYLATRAAQARRRRERDPERDREIQRRHRQRKKDGLVVPMAERRTHDPNHPRVPRAPFLAWVERTLPEYPNKEAFCELIGIPSRTLDRLQNDGHQLIELDTADRAFQREGSTTLLDEYPKLYDEAVAVT